MGIEGDAMDAVDLIEDDADPAEPEKKKKKDKKEKKKKKKRSSSSSDLEMVHPLQAQGTQILKDFKASGEVVKDIPAEFRAPPLIMLLKQLGATIGVAVVEEGNRVVMRQLDVEVAKLGPYGVVRSVLKNHGGRMSVKQCALLIDAADAYGQERLLLQMCGVLDSWHQRWQLKQAQQDFKSIGVVFDKGLTWMALKGQPPGPYSDSESEEGEIEPRHIVHVGEKGLQDRIRETLGLVNDALRTFKDDDGERDENKGLSVDGLPWWGDFDENKEWGPEDKASERANKRSRKLPAWEMRSEVTEAIEHFQVVVVVGATGCGKSTQLPLAWFEHCKEHRPDEKCRIICTEPRKIAAVTLCNRVALERGEAAGKTVGYKVRFEQKASEKTEVLYCTCSVLLRAMMRNPSLDGVTCVFLDEIHERDTMADFAMLLLKDLMAHSRPDLKVVLMSATVDPTWCQMYFNDCHTVELPGELPHAVDWHWLEDCIELTGHKPWVNDKVKKPIMRQEQIIEELPEKHHDKAKVIQDVMMASDEWIDVQMIVKLVEHIDVKEDLIDLEFLEDEEEDCKTSTKGAVLIFLPGMNEIRQVLHQLRNSQASRSWVVLPLHGAIPKQEQEKVFQRPPEGHRKIVCTTNIAESSLTIDDVVYVIDSGRERLQTINAETNVSSLATQWIGRGNALQRKGRAGRCRPGSYFALFSELQYKHAFVDSHLPEMQRTQVESLCLQVKALGFEKIPETLAKAPDPPDKRTVSSAVQTLKTLGAISPEGDQTRLGKLLASLPVHPQLGKLLLYARLFECTDAALTVAAGLDTGRVWQQSFQNRDLAERKRLELSGGLRSDHWALIQAYRQWRRAGNRIHDQKKIAESVFANHRSLETLEKIRGELLRGVQELENPTGWTKIVEAPSKREKALQAQEEYALLSAALAASFHLARITPQFDYVCLSSPPVGAAMQPSSVNAQKNLVEPGLFKECLAVWFSRLKTTQLFVEDCSIVRPVHSLLFGPPYLAPSKFPLYAHLQPPVGLDPTEEDPEEFAKAKQEQELRELEKLQAEAQRVEEIKDLIRLIYTEHNPEKLDDLDSLFIKYDGVEAEMYEHICKKYKVEPDKDYVSKEEAHDEEALASRLIRHADRHVPWLKCQTKEALNLLLELRDSANELLNRCVGKPLSGLDDKPARAIRSLRALLIKLGTIGNLKLKEHYSYGNMQKGEQISAPLEEPWVRVGAGWKPKWESGGTEGQYGSFKQSGGPPARKTGKQDKPPAPPPAPQSWKSAYGSKPKEAIYHKPSVGSHQQGDGLSASDRNRWKRDPDTELRAWLAQELDGHKDAVAHVDEVNNILRRELRYDHRLEHVNVNPDFIDSHADLFWMDETGMIGLVDLDASVVEEPRQRSRSPRGQRSTWQDHSANHGWGESWQEDNWHQEPSHPAQGSRQSSWDEERWDSGPSDWAAPARPRLHPKVKEKARPSQAPLKNPREQTQQSGSWGEASWEYDQSTPQPSQKRRPSAAPQPTKKSKGPPKPPPPPEPEWIEDDDRHEDWEANGNWNEQAVDNDWHEEEVYTGGAARPRGSITRQSAPQPPEAPPPWNTSETWAEEAPQDVSWGDDPWGEGGEETWAEADPYGGGETW